jgi:hypothetical protein
MTKCRQEQSAGRGANRDVDFDAGAQRRRHRDAADMA